MIKKVVWIIIVCVILCISSACSHEKVAQKKIRDIDYKMVNIVDIPTELEELITDKRNREFTLVYENNEDTYICIGYGKQLTGGYSVKIKELYETDNTIVINTTLVGPKEHELVLKANSYPYIVVKIKRTEKSIEFSI